MALAGLIGFWKCPKCHGVGKIAPFWSNHVEECAACDGTGNAFVDGEEHRSRRRIAEIEQAAQSNREK